MWLTKLNNDKNTYLERINSWLLPYQYSTFIGKFENNAKMCGDCKDKSDANFVKNNSNICLNCVECKQKYDLPNNIDSYSTRIDIDSKLNSRNVQLSKSSNTKSNLCSLKGDKINNNWICGDDIVHFENPFICERNFAIPLQLNISSFKELKKMEQEAQQFNY